MNPYKNNLPFRTLSIALLFLINLLITTSASARAEDLPLFQAENMAQKHCPSDEIVWLNTNSGIWHSKNSHWYGNTKSGAYVCKKEAIVGGYRGPLN